MLMKNENLNFKYKTSFVHTDIMVNFIYHQKISK